ncbi:MAG TPA: efflux RND transporter periplasmic adaptor subunit [Patescibacteria group bacterium]|nr:efflux RND transporter periplasmic adaptor subunit [Patescibacteria group bacterium]
MKLLKFLKFWRLPKKIWITTLIILIGTGGYYFWPKPVKEPIQTVEVKTGTVKSIISSSGTLEGTDSADLKFKISGKLNSITVKPGDQVKKGQLIASLDTRDLQINLQQAYNTFIAKEATAKRVEDDVKDHSSDESFTQKETRKAAQIARDNAYDDIKAAQRALEDAYLYAPLSGVVTKADPNAGQIVGVTDLITQIVDETEFVFETEVDESDIGKIKLGQQASVTLNSYPDQTFRATVSKITPDTETTDSGATIVIVKLALGKPEINFVSGINGQADIILEEVSNVLVIPVDALMDNDEVYVKKGGTFEKIKPELGLRSDLEAEVKSGLSADDQVVTNPQEVKTNGNGFRFPGQ